MTNAQRQQRARAKKAAQNLREMREVWVPAEHYDRLRVLCRYHINRYLAKTDKA